MNSLKKVLKKMIIFGITVCISMMLIIGLINYRVISLAKNYTHEIDNIPKADVALVLGALVHKNGRVSDILADRLDVGIELYKEGKVKKVLLSGDHGRKNYDEVNAMKKYVLEAGIDEKDVFMDHAGFSTYESIYRARDVFEVKSMIVVTQEYHLPRAVYIGRQLGIEAYGVPSDKHFYPKLMMYKIRESIARCKDFVYVNILKKKPTFLGEKINILGDGRRTND